MRPTENSMPRVITTKDVRDVRRRCVSEMRVRDVRVRDVRRRCVSEMFMYKLYPAPSAGDKRSPADGYLTA